MITTASTNITRAQKAKERQKQREEKEEERQQATLLGLCREAHRGFAHGRAECCVHDDCPQVGKLLLECPVLGGQSQQLLLENLMPLAQGLFRALQTLDVDLVSDTPHRQSRLYPSFFPTQGWNQADHCSILLHPYSFFCFFKKYIYKR